VIILHTTNERAMYKHWLQLDSPPDDCGVSDLHYDRPHLSPIAVWTRSKVNINTCSGARPGNHSTAQHILAQHP